jgi:hypothetical protein
MMVSIPFLILTLLGCVVCAEVTARVLRRLLPTDVEPRVAKRIMWASRSFAVLYPILQTISLFLMFSLMRSPLFGSPSAGYAMALMAPMLACAPLAAALGRSAGSVAVGAIPLVAIVISFTIPYALFVIGEMGPSLVWMVVQPVLWLACTVAGLKWVVRPKWPLDTSRFLRCPACGYSRQGLSGEVCPECGGALPMQPDAGASRTD